MSKLTETIFQGGSVITMIVLEMICFYLIINFNSQQQQIWLETMSVYTGGVTEQVDGVSSYIGLRATVDSLQQRLADIKTATEGVYVAKAAEVDSVRDDSLRQRFVYLTAEVVNKSPYGPNNTTIINRGKMDGIEIGQGVVGDRGLLGVVNAVSNEHARVMSLLHRDTKLSAGLKNNYFGTLRWDGKDPRKMTLYDLKSYVTVAAGDTIYTTGYSSIFPTGIALGTVAATEKLAGTGNWKITVDLLEDPLSMRYVFVIKDLFKEDIARLMNKDER